MQQNDELQHQEKLCSLLLDVTISGIHIWRHRPSPSPTYENLYRDRLENKDGKTKGLTS